jgi:hypothetical protein
MTNAYEWPQWAGCVLHTDRAGPTIISTMRAALIAVMASLLAACASSGLYNMSDTWCAAHPAASVARCPKNDAERRVVVNDREHGADSEGTTND